VFVTSAISSDPDATFQPGLYGEGTASSDRSIHRWMVYALDKRTGEVLWERLAHEGTPVDKRHIKSTYANSTAATNGRAVIAWFGSEGVVAYVLEGELLWQFDPGRLDVGAYDIPSYEWGPASSPVIWNDRVFVQCDTQGESFVVALDVDTGAEIWRTPRDELPSWGTPNVVEGPAGPELVTNASNFIRGYDPGTGEELWRLGGSSKITAPTPVAGDGLVIVSSGRQPEGPIFAVRLGSRGDLTLARGESESAAVAWSWIARGPYMPTPLVDDGRVFVLQNNGILDVYDLDSGEELFRGRLRHLGSGFSASPVAADGKIYIAGEDGEMLVLTADSVPGHVATNPMGESLMATPALSDGVMFVRGARHLFAVGRP
jgi:outer membrane protein assembly factor BamB